MRSLEKDLLLFEAVSFLSIFFQVRSFYNTFPSSSEATETRLQGSWHREAVLGSHLPLLCLSFPIYQTRGA